MWWRAINAERRDNKKRHERNPSGVPAALPPIMMTYWRPRVVLLAVAAGGAGSELRRPLGAPWSAG
jgi:hypothetical protein